MELGWVRDPQGAIKAHGASDLAVSRLCPSGVQLDLPWWEQFPLKLSRVRPSLAGNVFGNYLARVGVSVECNLATKETLEKQLKDVSPPDEAADSVDGVTFCR